MPIYGMQCECGHTQDEFLAISDRNNFIRCNECGAQTTRVVTGHIQRVEPTWLEDAINQLVPHGKDIEKPYDRNSFDRYCKVNKIDITTGGGPLN